MVTAVPEIPPVVPASPPDVSVLKVLSYFLRPSELGKAFRDEGLAPHIHLATLLIVVFATAIVVTIAGMLF
jgi:hypothetical protein